MNYDRLKHHRRSIRLKGYDYSQAGLYFLTICCQDHKCLFGHIKNGEMHLNEAGKMVEKWYHKLETKYPDIQCGHKVVMPNHFHCIIKNVGATPCGRPNTCHTQPNDVVSPNSTLLKNVVGWFKTMTTNEYIRGVKNLGWRRFDKRLWQRNYWEHIIRTEKSHDYIIGYIEHNPQNWERDKLFEE